MRIGIFSDVHGNGVGLDAVLGELEHTRSTGSSVSATSSKAGRNPRTASTGSASSAVPSSSETPTTGS